MSDDDLSIEPIVGWRVWGLAIARSGGPALMPAGAGRGAWPARRACRAACRAGGAYPSHAPRGNEHASPVRGCSCGVYASTTLRTLVLSTPIFPLVCVVGTVSMWGRVIEHEHGWRSEFAYPSRLTLVCGVCLRLGSGRGVPSSIVRDPREGRAGAPAMAVCTDHVHPMARPGSPTLAAADRMRAALLDRYAVDLMPFDSVRSLFERDPAPGPVPYLHPSVVLPPGPLAPIASPATTAPPGPPTRPAQPVAVPVGGARAVVAKESLVMRLGRGLWDVISFILGAAVLLFMCVATLQSCIVTVDATDRPVPRTSAPVRVVTDPSHPTTERAVIARRTAPEPLHQFEFVCGRSHGGWIELVPCSSPAPLFGFAESPSDEECFGTTVAFTRRPNYSVCWVSFDEGISVDPHAASANPFAGGAR